MKQLSSTDIEKDYHAVCLEKGIAVDYESKSYIRYKEAMNSIYHAVCLDIDDTITYKNKTDRQKIVETLLILTKRYVIVCFITGRGSTSTLKFLHELKENILDFDSTIDNSYFKRWYAIINNGCFLLYSDLNNNTNFLNKKLSFIDPEVKNEYMKLKTELQLGICELLSNNIKGIDQSKILEKSAGSIGENSLRFPFEPKYEKEITDNLLDKVKIYVRKKTNYLFGITRGVYHKNDNIVVEVSMTSKGKGIDKFEKYLGIPKNRMVRIGDQGDEFGNDYDMLNSVSGFSVKKISKESDRCWPIAESIQHSDSEILKGVDATVFILKRLMIFPSICLETPRKIFYLPRLAISEQRNINFNFSTYSYYSNKVNYALSKNCNNKEVWDYIDKETGAFFIKDYEYELLKENEPDHILFKIYDSSLKRKYDTINIDKQPRLKFSLKNDFGIILRGPLNYYYGLSFRKENRNNIDRNFVIRLSQKRRNFLKIFLSAIESKHRINMNNSINRRVFLGAMDSIRDYLLIAINLLIQKVAPEKDAVYVIKKDDELIYRTYQLAKENLTFMYNCLFSENIGLRFIQSFNSFVKFDIISFAKEFEKHVDKIEKKDDKFDYKKGCRVWREIDSFYENIIAMETALSRLISEDDLTNKFPCFYGVRYGGMELPVIVNLLLDFKGFQNMNSDCEFGFISLSTGYKKNHSNMLDFSRDMHKINFETKSCGNMFNVILDDNLLTGRTLQIVSNIAIKNGIVPSKLFVVRYPSLNRVEHMFLPNHGAPDTELFWKYVYGLTSPTPYTRLNASYVYSDSEKEKYLDELGRFNKTRIHVSEVLYKNGLFGQDSEVNLKVVSDRLKSNTI